MSLLPRWKLITNITQYSRPSSGSTILHSTLLFQGTVASHLPNASLQIPDREENDPVSMNPEHIWVVSQSTRQLPEPTCVPYLGLTSLLLMLSLKVLPPPSHFHSFSICPGFYPYSLPPSLPPTSNSLSFCS